MPKLARAALICAVAGSTLTTLVAPVAAAPPSRDQRGAVERPDSRPGPLSQRDQARRNAAWELIRSGQRSPNNDGVVALAEEKYVEAVVGGEARLFTILAEFGSEAAGRFGRVPGPLHNEIPVPNRETVDGQNNPDYNPAAPYDNFRAYNAVLEGGHLVSDFDEAYYEDLFFGPENSMQDFYLAQSDGAYTITGEVGNLSNGHDGWVQVPGNASLYGDNAIEDFGGAWRFIEDSADAWYADALATLGSDAAVNAYLSQFDVWDRYDYNNDGNFDEPDGYIDHFQAVHAGEGEDAGGGAQGADAIWSHRWYVNQTDFGQTGPSNDALLGGARVGDSNYWIGDYTVEGENGGLGVFVHEYGHDLNLPDFYDTNAGENGTAFWTVMSSGSWLGDGTEDIGTRPNYMGPWEKLQLGWLDIADVVSQGETSNGLTLAPSEAVIVDVADEPITTTYTAPYSGSSMWWTTSADDLNTTLTNTFDLSGVGRATMTVKAWYEIEAGFDFLYGEYSTDGGDTWIQTGAPVDGSSNGRWTTLRYAIPGGSAETMFRFRFQSDGGVHEANAFLDNFVLKSGGTTIFTDDVESGEDGWTREGGFKISTGTESVEGDRYFIAENRTYVGYDAGLQTGPYQFSFALTDPDKVEHFGFQDGLLVWMVDEAYSDNNNSEHTGRGLSLPVDARPAPFKYSDGTQPSNRRQPFDATFGLQDVPTGPTDDPEPGNPDLPCAGLHKQVVVGKGPNQHIEYLCAWPTADEREAVDRFVDSAVDAYWDDSNPQNSTKTADSGVEIEVTDQNTNGPLTVNVTNPAAE
jgi:immune inhibitor A